MYTMPDGSQVEWSWRTLAEVARRLTVDQNGKNATEADFDRKRIIQYGYVPQYQSPSAMASFWGADKLYDEANNAIIPPQWGEAWKWYYFGMWGSNPFIPNQAAINKPLFGGGNPFGSSSIAMAITQSWYISPNVAGGNKWDLAALPSYNGKIHGRVDADTFRIWKGTQHPREAFEVLSYFIGPASEDLLRAYGGLPARTADQDAFFAARAKQYSWVQNWDVLRAGLNYPDIPSAEGYMPNFIEAWNRLSAFGNFLVSTDNISVDAEMENLRRDLDGIFKK
jgi:multiple sugar transport system substrate-binding protein